MIHYGRNHPSLYDFFLFIYYCSLAAHLRSLDFNHWKEQKVLSNSSPTQHKVSLQNWVGTDRPEWVTGDAEGLSERTAQLLTRGAGSGRSLGLFASARSCSAPCGCLEQFLTRGRGQGPESSGLWGPLGVNMLGGWTWMTQAHSLWEQWLPCTQFLCGNAAVMFLCQDESLSLVPWITTTYILSSLGQTPTANLVTP